MTDPIRFGLLGPVEMWCGQREISVGSPQQRALLAMLLLRHGERLGLGEIVRALWGEEIPRGAYATVRTYVSRLRRILAGVADGASGPLDIRTEADGYRMLVEPTAIDLHNFRAGVASAQRVWGLGQPHHAARQLAGALSLWRGTPLTGLGHINGPFFSHQRTWLEQLLIEATEERLTVDIEIGNYADAAADLKAAVVEHPYRERLWELLMLALYRLSRQAEALAAYREVSGRLASDLGVRPGPGLQRIHARILATDPELITGLPSAV